MNTMVAEQAPSPAESERLRRLHDICLRIWRRHLQELAEQEKAG